MALHGFPITATCPACPGLPWGVPWITRSRAITRLLNG
jgi:hypothetical protein